MIGLSRVVRLYVPLAQALEAHAPLQRVGVDGLEGFVLWAGTVEGRAARVHATYVPVQHGLSAAEGLAVVVDGAELHRLNKWLYRRELTLIAQLHSHPGLAYHSDTDDAFPIATTAGSLSLVLPDFASAPFALTRSAVYRLTEQGAWSRLTPAAVNDLIVIEE